MPLCVCRLSVRVCLCVFQVRRMVAASPRVSGFTSVIRPFRWYRSHGYSTLRRTCFFMRNYCKDKRKNFFCGAILSFLFKVLHLPVLPVFLYLSTEERLYSTDSQIKLVIHIIMWKFNIIYFRFDRLITDSLFFRKLLFKSPEKAVNIPKIFSNHQRVSQSCTKELFALLTNSK